VPRPPKELKGFAKVKLGPGKTTRVRIALDRRAFSYFDDKAMTWQVAPADFDILVGSSSQQIELRGKGDDQVGFHDRGHGDELGGARGLRSRSPSQFQPRLPI
jgi:hypothetical protein